MDTQTNPAPASDEKIEQAATQAATEATNGKAAAEPKRKKAPAKKEPAKKAPAAKAESLTFGELAESYLAKLESDGKSEGTLFSYRLEMRLALADLGENSQVAKLTRPKVQAFLESDPVTKTRTGLPKSPLSIAKTTRVLKQALNHAVELGVIEKNPIPE